VRPRPLITGTTTLPNSVASRALNASSRGNSPRPSSWLPSAKSLPITTTALQRRSTSRYRSTIREISSSRRPSATSADASATVMP
jgi:hypothetical protein